MKKSIVLWTAGSFLLLLLLAGTAGAAPQPNILFILTDDEGWPTLSSYGKTWMHSVPAEVPGPNPRMDSSRLLKETRQHP